MLNLIETHSKSDLVKERFLLNDLLFSYYFEYSGDLIQFELTGDVVLLASKPLMPVFTNDTKQFELPNIFPVRPTVTLNLQHFYDLQNIYRKCGSLCYICNFDLKVMFAAVNKNARISHPHTIFVHYNKTQVKNIYEEEVTDAQISGRALLKAFTVAASYAKQRFGVKYYFAIYN